MGRDYCVAGKRNGRCPWKNIEKTPKSRFMAIFWFIVLSFRYPIVDLEQRIGYADCDKTNKDCDDCPLYQDPDDKIKCGNISETGLSGGFNDR